jgi:hypothetical protein
MKQRQELLLLYEDDLLCILCKLLYLKSFIVGVKDNTIISVSLVVDLIPIGWIPLLMHITLFCWFYLFLLTNFSRGEQFGSD